MAGDRWFTEVFLSFLHIIDVMLFGPDYYRMLLKKVKN